MHTVTVTFILHPGQLAAFMPLMVANARQSVDQEPGCRQFDICTGRIGAESAEVFLYEVYDSAEAFAAHLARISRRSMRRSAIWSPRKRCAATAR
jgi:quinol monooxygenase YgiN